MLIFSLIGTIVFLLFIAIVIWAMFKGRCNPKVGMAIVGVCSIGIVIMYTIFFNNITWSKIEDKLSDVPIDVTVSEVPSTVSEPTPIPYNPKYITAEEYLQDERYNQEPIYTDIYPEGDELESILTSKYYTFLLDRYKPIYGYNVTDAIPYYPRYEDYDVIINLRFDSTPLCFYIKGDSCDVLIMDDKFTELYWEQVDLPEGFVK